MHFSACVTLFIIFNSCSKLPVFHQYLSHLKLKLHSELDLMENPRPEAFFHSSLLFGSKNSKTKSKIALHPCFLLNTSCPSGPTFFAH